MSNQGYDQSQEQHQDFQSNNPWASSGTPGESQSYGSAPPQQQQGGYAPPQQHEEGYVPPPGPPPGQQPARSATFKETDFVPENERGEQREAMEQFELNKSGNESQTDRDVAQLQQEFPGVDGSLIAAIHSDNGNMGATREMLQELATQT